MYGKAISISLSCPVLEFILHQFLYYKFVKFSFPFSKSTSTALVMCKLAVVVCKSVVVVSKSALVVSKSALVVCKCLRMVF